MSIYSSRNCFLSIFSVFPVFLSVSILCNVKFNTEKLIILYVLLYFVLCSLYTFLKANKIASIRSSIAYY